MKKLILLILISISIMSCSNSMTDHSKVYNQELELDNAKIVIFDSCEYIQFHVYAYNSITHKGNCKFCKQRQCKK